MLVYYVPMQYHIQPNAKRGISFLITLIKILSRLQFRKTNPVVLTIMDNFPTKNQKRTNKEKAYDFLDAYGIKLALRGKLSDLIQIGAMKLADNLENYESLYMTSQQIKLVGPRPIASANFMNLTSIRSIDHILMHHPLLGLKNYNSELSVQSECELCWLVLVITKPDLYTNIFPSELFSPPTELATERGNLQFDLSCLYKPNIQSKCPKMVRRLKLLLKNSAIRNGEKLTQYSNTPSCDLGNDSRHKYWSAENYELLRKSKQVWDPENTFNHCQSVGNTVENCCPADA